MENEIQISYTNAEARRIYNKHPEFREPFERKLGKSFFSSDPMDRIKTLEDAYESNGERPIFHSTDTPDEVAYKESKAIVKALNDDHLFPDWTNHSQKKYYAYVTPTPGSGLGLAYFAFSYASYHTGVGSRLCLNSQAKAKYFVETFPSYAKFMF